MSDENEQEKPQEGLKSLKVRVDENLCIGAATCTVVDADHYKLNDEGKAEVVENGEMKGYEYELKGLSSEQVENIVEGAKSCPTKAVFVNDEQGNQLFP